MFQEGAFVYYLFLRKLVQTNIQEQSNLSVAVASEQILFDEQSNHDNSSDVILRAENSLVDQLTASAHS